MKLLVYRVLRKFKMAEYWAIAILAIGLLWVVRLLPGEKALSLLDRAARRVGPLVGRHRVAVENLRQAFPEKSGPEIEAIAGDMWGNMARLLGEYVFLDQIMDIDPDRPGEGHIEVEGVDIFTRLVDQPDRPAIFFTAHMGNFELLPIAAAAFDLEVTALFRPPNNPVLARYLLRARKTAMGHLVPSRAGASIALARILEKGGKVGMLVDQKFHNGQLTRFFDRDCLTSPLLAKLTRQFDCDVYPARCIRLPGGRFRITLFDRIDIPRLDNGRVDTLALTQQVTGIVEDWIREDPGQWMWFHKRWSGLETVRNKNN